MVPWGGVGIIDQHSSVTQEYSRSGVQPAADPLDCPADPLDYPADPLDGPAYPPDCPAGCHIYVTGN